MGATWVAGQPARNLRIPRILKTMGGAHVRSAVAQSSRQIVRTRARGRALWVDPPHVQCFDTRDFERLLRKTVGRLQTDQRVAHVLARLAERRGDDLHVPRIRLEVGVDHDAVRKPIDGAEYSLQKW